MSTNLYSRLLDVPLNQLIRKATEIVGKNPEAGIRKTRERLANSQGRGASIREKLAVEVSNAAHGILVMTEKDSEVGPVWEFARLLHNLGKTQDAKTYIELAAKLAPDDPKILARQAEIYLDLQEETGDTSYGLLAYLAITQCYNLEDSEYVDELSAKVAYATNSKVVSDFMDSLIGLEFEDHGELAYDEAALS